jgi:uncharacterized protein DUF4349
MRGPDSDQPKPEMATALLAIDATLAGEPVEPEFAELAELALILRRERPRTGEGFTASLDERVARRFARPAPQRGAGRRRWLWGPAAGLAAAAAGFAAVIVLIGGNGGGSLSTTSGAATSRGAPAFSASSAASSVAPGAASSSAGSAAANAGVASGGAGSAASHSASAKNLASAISSPGAVKSRAPSSRATSPLPQNGLNPAPGPVGAPGPVSAPAPSGNRQIVQSAQLQLSAPGNRIDDVAQQVFDVMGNEKGIVNSSNVTAGSNANGGADFQLSVPSANLGPTLAALSHLRGARVLSRTDATADITGQVGGAGERLAEARALRRSLLKQLAAATTSQQVDSIKLRLHDADASIASDLSTLRGLQRQVAYSRISLYIQPASAPAPVKHGSSFTIGRAAHDAGRVLVVAAGVALIVLAVLVPVGLVAALAAWAGLAVRRRRREQALDLV